MVEDRMFVLMQVCLAAQRRAVHAGDMRVNQGISAVNGDTAMRQQRDPFLSVLPKAATSSLVHGADPVCPTRTVPPPSLRILSVLSLLCCPV